MVIAGQTRAWPNLSGKVASQTPSGRYYMAFPAWTLLKTVGTSSIFMDSHPLPDPKSGAPRRTEAGNAKRDSTIHQMVSACRPPVSEKSLCSYLTERENQIQ